MNVCHSLPLPPPGTSAPLKRRPFPEAAPSTASHLALTSAIIRRVFCSLAAAFRFPRSAASSNARNSSTFNQQCDFPHCEVETGTQTKQIGKKGLVAALATSVVLAVVAERESHGHAILKRVVALSIGNRQWADSMLYPLLDRLWSAGPSASIASSQIAGKPVSRCQVANGSSGKPRTPKGGR